MPDYGRELSFVANVDPGAAGLADARDVAQRAEALGFDFFSVQDHPYVPRFLDTLALIGDLLARTERIRAFTNVANLPLRAPALLAKQAATLDVLSGGRFELGLGAGGFWEGIKAMGGPDRTRGEAVDALAEAIEIVRRFWAGGDSISFEGRFYRVKGLKPGPPPAHEIGIWLGAYGPRMLALTGRLADGWVPSLPYAPPERVPELARRVDEAAREAGREPRAVRRVYNLMGTITDGPAEELLQGPPDHWVEELSRFALELGFDTFAFWAREDSLRQLERFAQEVMPAVREAVARARR